MGWEKFKEKIPPEGKLVMIFRKDVRKFFCGYYERGAKMDYMTKLPINGWRACSGNFLKLTLEDYWLLIPDLVESENLTTTCLPIKK